MKALDRGSATYNAGVGRGYTVRQVLETARRVTGRAIPEETGPRRPGDVPRLIVESDRIRRDPGWKPRFPELDRIVETAWRWHRDHPEGYGG